MYCSNESQYNVFFDNLQLIHTRGQLMEETHYYPFGLTMAGISSKSIGSIENKMKYNGYELNKDFDINFNESFYRLHDPQLGRFWQADPRPNMFESLYAAMGNNPALNYDVLGDSAGPKSGFNFSAVKLPKYEYEDYGQGKLFNLLANANAIGSNAGINIWNGTVGLAEDATNVAFSSAGRQEVLMRYATGIYEALMVSSGIEGKIASGVITPGSVWNSVKYLFTTPQGMEQVSTLVAGLALPGGAKTLLRKLSPELRVVVEALVGGSREKAAAKGGTNAFTHNYKYADRVRVRGVQDPVSHNFPYSFDDAILSTKPILKENGYKIFQQSGTMNGKNGVFEIGLTKDGIIDHRFFRPTK